ncbi:hypothetical protein TrST_g5020 [Triparma strigata]|uniref:Uncharacterized protein n=1 Tax=Triparma strigata TaxID=1606541 RepID=A0A9W7C7T8_9STRA|nr:hypothetical protein TrST_g5020 [Triparma strigata]
MSKRTSEDLSNTIEVADPNSVEGGGDGIELLEGSEFDSAADETPAVGGDDFMHTDDFRRLFVGFVMVDTLVAMRWLDRKWHKVVEKKLIELEDEPFGEIIVHGGNDISSNEAYSDARKKRMEQVTKVVFLLNTTKKVQELGQGTFRVCTSLRVMKVPDSLQTFGGNVFYLCSKLVPSDIDDGDSNAVVAYLRSMQ